MRAHGPLRPSHAVRWHLTGQALGRTMGPLRPNRTVCTAACLLLLTLLRLPLPLADAVAAAVAFTLQKVMPS
jgi:hypothetical protein